MGKSAETVTHREGRKHQLVSSVVSYRSWGREGQPPMLAGQHNITQLKK